MSRISRLVLLPLVVVLAGCNDNDETMVSTGPKIFATNEVHVADFAGDPALNGSNAIEKADDFCNRSASKPDGGTYKALLVDGTTRDAPSLTDWVLQPSTTYYRSYNDTPIGTTTAAAIFDIASTDLDHVIAFCGGSRCDAWTGIGDASTFAADTSNCHAWGASATGISFGWMGYIQTKDAAAIHNRRGVCDPAATQDQAHLFCVEQP